MDEHDGTADRSASEVLNKATTVLEGAVRSRVRAVPAAEIRRLGRVRRQRRTAAVTGAAVAVLIGVTVAGHAEGISTSGLRTVTPADRGGDKPEEPSPQQQIPAGFLPVARLSGLLGGSGWHGEYSEEGSRASASLKDCESAAAEMSDNARAAVTIYASANNRGLTEIVSHFPDATSAQTGFLGVSTALSVCAGNTDPGAAGTYDENSRSALVIVMNRGTQRDPSRVSHFRIERSGAVLVLLAASEFTVDPDPAAHAKDPLVSAMDTAATLASAGN